MKSLDLNIDNQTLVEECRSGDRDAMSFIEPSLRYHFPQECKVPNIWTDDEPCSLSIPIGFRFSW